MNTPEQWYLLWLAVPLVVAAGIFTFAWLALRRSKGQLATPRGESTPSSGGGGSLSQFVKDTGGDTYAAWPVLITWVVAVIALQTLFPHIWDAWSSAGFWTASALVVIYAASRMWTKKADRFAVALFIIAVLMVVIHEAPMWDGVAEKTRATVEDLISSFKSGRRTIHRVLKPGEETTVEIPYGYAFDFSCDAPGLIISPLRAPCVPEGGVLLGNAVSHITVQALDQELRVSVRLTPAS